MNAGPPYIAGSEVLRDLGRIIRFESAVKNHFETKMQRSSTYLLAVAAGIFATLILIAGINKSFPLPAWAIGSAIVAGILSQLIALLALVLQTIGGVYGAVVFFRRANENHRAEYLHDFSAAMMLCKTHGLAAIEAADLWMEQKIQRMDRRQFRFLGGPEKYAVIAILGAASAAWKEMGPELVAGTPSVLLYVAALVLGFLVGGMISNLMRDRLMYQRDLLRLAKSGGHTGTEAAPTEPPTLAGKEERS